MRNGLSEGHRFIRVFCNQSAVLETDLFRGHLKDMSGNFGQLRFQILHRHIHRSAANRCSTASERPDAVRNPRGIAVLNEDIIHADSELVRDNLGK